MSKRTISILVIVLGLLLVVISLAADVLGIGIRAGFGVKQTLGTVVGALVVAGGVWWGWRKPGQKK